MSDPGTRADQGIDPNMLIAKQTQTDQNMLIERKLDYLEQKLPNDLKKAVEKAMEEAAEKAKYEYEEDKNNEDRVVMTEIFRAKYGITISPKEKKVKVRNRDHYYDEYAPTHTDLCK